MTKRSYRTITEETKATIADMIAEGYTNTKIAKHLGIFRQHVAYYRKQATANLEPEAQQGAKIYVFDIETLPIESFTWGLFDQNVGLNQIKTDWAILSWAGKWIGDDAIDYYDTRNERNIRDDRDIVAALCQRIDEADIVVGANLKRFDMRKLRARAIQHGLPPFREPHIVDTMLAARATAAFTSNKLEYLSKTLTDAPKSAHTQFPGFELWLGVMRNDPAAWAEMEAYNKQDVVATEKLYKALLPWMRQHPNVAHYYGDEAMRCPRCGSTHLYENGTVRLGVSEYQRYQCGGCTSHSRTRQTLNTKAKRLNLLALS